MSLYFTLIIRDGSDDSVKGEKKNKLASLPEPSSYLLFPYPLFNLFLSDIVHYITATFYHAKEHYYLKRPLKVTFKLISNQLFQLTGLVDIRFLCWKAFRNFNGYKMFPNLKFR